MAWSNHIERVPGVMGGKPVFKGTRLTVEFVLERLAQGATRDELIIAHPTLKPEHIQAALEYALAIVRHDDLVGAA